jgi:hypothetical protein
MIALTISKKRYMLNSVAGATLRIMSENPIFVKVHFVGSWVAARKLPRSEEGYEASSHRPKIKSKAPPITGGALLR